MEAGQPLTEGSLNPHRVLRIQGREAAQMYLLTEIQKVYRSQGQNIHDKHFEVIIRKMMSKVSGQPRRRQPAPARRCGRPPGVAQRRTSSCCPKASSRPSSMDVLLGVTKASLSTDSWLSASSFQHTIKVLAGAAIGSTTDPLFGLKENVIIGKLLPAGTGFIPGRFAPRPGDGGDGAAPPRNGPRSARARLPTNHPYTVGATHWVALQKRRQKWRLFSFYSSLTISLVALFGYGFGERPLFGGYGG